MTIVGLAIGLLATAAASRYLSGLLFGVTPLDPVSLLLVTIALVLVTMAASLVPAQRATHIDPLVALRCE